MSKNKYRMSEADIEAQKQTHRRHPKQTDPFALATEEEKERYKQEFMELEHFLFRMCVHSYEGAPIFKRVEPMEFYRDMFPEGSFEECTWEPKLDKDGNAILDKNGQPVTVANTGIDRKPNGMISILNDPEQRGRSYTRIVFDDLAEIEANLDKPMALISPIGYSGRQRRSHLAYCFYGMIIDLDDVGIYELKSLINQMQADIIPMATYLVHTTSGFHVVYLFENPVPAYPRFFDSLNRLKADLSDQIWDSHTSRDKNKQFQGIFQGFRMVGTPTKLGEAYRSNAYKFGNKTTIRNLNRYVKEENRCNFDDVGHISLDDAHELWEDWYERRISEGRPVGDYKLSEKERERRRAWYENWKIKMKRGAKDGNRHYCIGILFHYAMKAEIPLEEVLADALGMVEYLNNLTMKPDNQFTDDDVYAAMIYYDRRFIKMGRDGIQRLTKIDIGETKRNGRKMKDHLQKSTFINPETKRPYPNPCKSNREAALNWMRENGEITGRPDKQAIIQEWRKNNPDKKKSDCIRETGISKPTVYKWWDC